MSHDVFEQSSTDCVLGWAESCAPFSDEVAGAIAIVAPPILAARQQTPEQFVDPSAEQQAVAERGAHAVRLLAGIFDDMPPMCVNCPLGPLNKTMRDILTDNTDSQT
jgi:hypothetical protein